MKDDKLPLVQIGSLDLFWMPQLARALSHVARVRLYSTWTLKRKSTWAWPSSNAWVLHYLLMLYKIYPWLQFHNHTYLQLCKLFDYWFRSQMVRQAEVIYFMNGFGLSTMRKAGRWGIQSIVECGCSHVEHQHEIVAAEYRRNGLRYSLFPSGYRKRLVAELTEADYVQVPSKFASDSYIERGIPPSKVLLAHYGYEPGLFFPVKKQKNKDEPLRFICPSGVNLRKGARILAQAWRRATLRNAELHWVGSPSPATEHLFTSIPPGIIFEPWRPQATLADLYRQCDVMILPTFEDGFGMVIIEAAACGLPVIITPNCCAHEFFTEGTPEGWLIETNNIDMLISVLEQAAEDRELVVKKGKAAAARANVFTWDNYSTQVCANFTRIGLPSHKSAAGTATPA